MDKQYLTARESADFLRIKKQTLYSLLKKQKLKGYKPNGKNIFFCKDDLQSYMTGEEVNNE